MVFEAMIAEMHMTNELIVAGISLSVAAGIQVIGIGLLATGGGLALLGLCLVGRGMIRPCNDQTSRGLAFVAAFLFSVAGLALFFAPSLGVLLLVLGMGVSLLGVGLADTRKERASHVMLSVGVILIVVGWFLLCMYHVAHRMNEFYREHPDVVPKSGSP